MNDSSDLDEVGVLMRQATGAAESAVALVFGDRTVSRGEFSARVSVLARRLIDSGVGPEVTVAVAMPRSVELVVALHAVVAAGGAYVPLDIDAPVDRVQYMVATACSRHVLVCAGSVPGVIADLEQSVRVIEVDGSGAVPEKVEPVTDVDRVRPVHPDDAAYTLFTSGSTGRPKGVTVTHRAVANRLSWMRDWYSIGSGDILLQKTPATFDVSVWEFFLPAAVGATLVIAEPGRHGDPDYLADVIEREQVSVVHFVPSMLSAFSETLGKRLGSLSSLRLLVTSGEALSASVADRVLRALSDVELQNLYGPTEAAVDVTAHRVGPGDELVPIGVPVPGTSTYVLDRWLQWVPQGVPGELYLGGVQLARGYASRADLTAERFVADPFGGPGERLYRTGDLVRWNVDGQIEYLGRTDFQVKLRGQRLELGEVEEVLASAPGVVHAAAAVVEFPAGAQLVGYVSPADVDLDGVRETLAARLPEYMRPTQWVVLDALPLNNAGKIARRELPEPKIAEREYVGPESDAEVLVAAVFADVLGVDRVSVTESFFDAGGNSLAAMRVIAGVERRSGVRLPLAAVVAHPTVRALAAVHDSSTSSDARSVIELQRGGDSPPVFFIHPAGGLAEEFRAIVPALPGVPVYGVQDPSVVDGAERAGSLTEMAERHLEAVRGIQPSGPYRFAGLSLGGALAFEMAVQLQKAGETVEFLLLMDSAAGAPARLDKDGIPGAVAAVETSLKEAAGDLADRIDLGDAGSTMEEVTNAVVDQLVALGVGTRESVRATVDHHAAVVRLLAEYEPATFRGDIHFVTAVHGKDDPDAFVRFWRDHVDGEIVTLDVERTHLALGSEAVLRELGPHVHDWLDAAATALDRTDPHGN